MFRHQPHLARSVSEFQAQMETFSHSRHTRVVRGRAAWNNRLSLFDPTTGDQYNYGQLAAKIATFNDDLKGNYTTNPINITDVPVDSYGLVEDDATRTHIVPSPDPSFWPVTNKLAARGNTITDPYYTALSRPLASYVCWRLFDFNGDATTSFGIQFVRIGCNARNYIVVKMKFQYDLHAYFDAQDHPWPCDFSDFELVTSGSNGSGSDCIGQNGYLEIPLPIPTYDDPSDALPDSTGWAHVPFFDISWDEFQARVAT